MAMVPALAAALARQDQAVLPAWLQVGNESFLNNWENRTNTVHTAGGLPEYVEVNLASQPFRTASGVQLADWLISKQAVIIGYGTF